MAYARRGGDSVMQEFDLICERCDVLGEFFPLIEALIEDVKHLEAETVKARYELSCYVQNSHREFLRADILSDLRSDYRDNRAYQAYIEQFCGGQDPFESTRWVKHMMKLAHMGQN